MNNNPTISLYKNVTDNKGTLIEVLTVIGKDFPEIEKIINELRSENDPSKKDVLKKSLPAVTWSGTFKKRLATELIEYSSLICIDIDKLSQAEHDELKTALKSDPYTFYLFTSPSGHGLKILFFVDGGPEMHLQNFLDIEYYFKEKYKVKIDKSGKDICRLCFLSWDPDNYLNLHAKVFEPLPKKKKSVKSLIEPPKKSTFNDVVSFTNNKLQFEPGNRNNWIHLFSNNANRMGFSETETLSYLLTNYNSEDIKESEIKSTVHSAFKNTYEHAKNQKFISTNKNFHSDNSHLRNLSDTSTDLSNQKPEITQEEFSEKYQFFDIKWKSDIDKDGNTTRKVRGIEINYLRFLAILADLGFRRIDMDRGHYYIHVENNVIQEVDDIFIKGVFKKYLETMPEVIHLDNAIIHRDMILNYMIGRQTNFFDKNILCHLPMIDMEQINEDSRNEAFFYYANKCVKVTSEKIELIDYTNLSEKYVWNDSILTRDVNLLEPEFDQDNNLWAQFLYQVCDRDNERLLVLMQIIGYMMHKYYEGKMKAIVFTDSRISDDPQGRTGKGLIYKGIRQMMNRDNKTDRGVLCTLNGKEFNPDNERRFEKCDINTRVIHINDVRNNYDVERHYNEIEDGITVNKKFQLPFTIHAKIGISTNRTLKINGDSSLDRFQVFDLSAHYSKDFTPEKEFGKWFFRDFTEHEWNLFDSFMLYCMKTYLKNGLGKYKSINLEKRLMHEQIGEELINFLEDFPNASFQENWNGDFGIIPMREYDKRALYDLFVQLNKVDTKRYSQRRFTNKLRHFKNLSDKWKPDSQDKEGNYLQERRSHSKDYVWFVENKIVNESK